uniref:MYND-type domain-containing protein n=1 Tax=Emiliania huxleyi TaxID=2903 RepID=A0A7S3RDI8_EMIHU
MPTCNACGESLAPSEFSKAQLKKVQLARCKSCVEQNKEVHCVTIDGSDPEGLGVQLLSGPGTMLSQNVQALLSGSARIDDEKMCDILGALSCANRDSMLRVAQSEKEQLLRGSVDLVQRDAATDAWAKSGRLSALGQGLADAVPGWCKDTFVVECNLGWHSGELDLVGALVKAVDALPKSVAPDHEVLSLLAGMLDNMGTSCVHFEQLGMAKLLRLRAFTILLERDAWLVDTDDHFERIVEHAKVDQRSLRKALDTAAREAVANAAKRAARHQPGACPGAAAVVELHELLSDVQTGMANTQGICRSCNATGVALKACARCKTACASAQEPVPCHARSTDMRSLNTPRRWYCSPSCQKADWKLHKKECRQAVATQDCGADLKTAQALAYNKFQENMCEVRRALGKLMQTDASLHFKDVAIVLDLGLAVALDGEPRQQRQPFELYLVKDWQARRNIPHGWFYPGTEVYENNLKVFLGQMQRVRDIMAEGMFLVVTYDQSGSNVFRMQIQHPTADLEMSEANIRATARMSDLEYKMRYTAIQLRCSGFGA